MSLQFLHVPQADMLVVGSRPVCSLFITGSCTFEYAAPEGGQYNDVLANDTMVDIKWQAYLLYAYLAGGVSGYLHKANFLLCFHKTLLINTLVSLVDSSDPRSVSGDNQGDLQLWF